MRANKSPLWLAMGFIANNSVVHAQNRVEFSATVEEIVVTANRRQEMLQDVPLSIAVFDENFFKESGLTEFSDLENYAASLKITTGATARSTAIRIRGIGSTGDNAGVDPSVGVFIDGVYQGRAGMSISDLIDIERIEVLRGPQGTLYGKNTAAGAISVISKSPGYDFEGTGEVVMGNYGAQEFRGTVNVPFNDEGDAVRISGYSVERDGFDDNTFDGSEINDSDKWGVKARALWEFDTIGSFMLTLDSSKDDSVCCAPDVLTYDGPSMLAITFDDLAASNPNVILPAADPFDRNISVNQPFSNEVEVQGVALEWNKDLETDHILTWVNAYRTYESHNEVDGDFSPFNAVFNGSDEDLSQTSSEFRIASPEGETIDYQVGLYYYYSKMDTVGVLGMGPDLRQTAIDTGNLLFLFFDPNTQTFANTDTNRHETTNYATFGQATWNITDELNATLGLRYTWERKERVGSQVSTPTPAFDLGTFGPDIYLDEERTKEDVSPAFSIRYFPRPMLMYYASVAKGFKSGGFNQLRTAGGLETEFDDEESISYEAGFKGTFFDRSVQFNTTFFYVDYDEFQAQTFDGTSVAVRNAGSMESYGAEIEWQWVPAERWSLGGSLGYTKSQYAEFDQGECTVQQRQAAWEALPNPPAYPGAAPCVQDLAGEDVDNTPDMTVSTYGQYDGSIPGIDQVGWFARLEHVYTDSYFLTSDLDPNLETDATNIFNARLGLRDMDDVWEATAWIRNLTDEEYYVYGFDIPTLSGYAVFNAPSQTFGLSLRYNF